MHGNQMVSTPVWKKRGEAKKLGTSTVAALKKPPNSKLLPKTAEWGSQKRTGTTSVTLGEENAR